ncbi:hypothetical protein Hhel01_00020 [Haloferula helveola]
MGKMKQSPISSALLACALLAPVATAQSIENFNNPASSDIANEVALEKVAENRGELITQPSRYVGLDLDAYLRSLSSSFEMRTRARDPFGRHQDPNFKPPAPKITRKPKPGQIVKERATPFPDIVAAIPITTIIPGKQKFLIGGQSYGIGQRLKLNTGKSEPLIVHVVSVETDRVTFRNGLTNELAAHTFEPLPGGMTPGTPSKPAGLEVNDGEVPIDISAGVGNSLSSRR